MRSLGPVDATRNMSPIRRFRAVASDELNAMTVKIVAEHPTVDPKEITTLRQNTPLNKTLTDVADAGSEVPEEDPDRKQSLAKAQRLFNIPLSNAKRQAAVGKRGQAPDQFAVMVKHSASPASISASCGLCRF